MLSIDWHQETKEMRLREMMEMVVTILDGKLERKIFFFFPLSEDASLF